jgi:hypothetical protein
MWSKFILETIESNCYWKNYLADSQFVHPIDLLTFPLIGLSSAFKISTSYDAVRMAKLGDAVKQDHFRVQEMFANFSSGWNSRKFYIVRKMAVLAKIVYRAGGDFQVESVWQYAVQQYSVNTRNINNNSMGLFLHSPPYLPKWNENL